MHFDIKCDNILLQPLEGIPESEFWHPSTEEPPFSVALADFGESKLCSFHDEVLLYTAQRRYALCLRFSAQLLICSNRKRMAMRKAGRATATSPYGIEALSTSRVRRCSW